MSLNTELIRAQIQFLRKMDRQQFVFGAIGHGYEFRPCVSEREVQSFEEKFSIELPVEYRQFVMEVGNGGAGPYYGILGLDELIETGDDYWDDLKAPFPYSTNWRGRSELLDAIRTGEGNEEKEKLTDGYWDIARRPGSISICEFGCALRFLLVVNGRERGNIWFDSTADLEGYSPVGIDRQGALDRFGNNWCRQNSTDGSRVGFADWYQCWLDWACALVQHEVSKGSENRLKA